MAENDPKELVNIILSIILSKLSALDLLSSVLNWIIAFLTDRAEVVGFLQCIPLHVT